MFNSAKTSAIASALDPAQFASDHHIVLDDGTIVHFCKFAVKHALLLEDSGLSDTNQAILLMHSIIRVNGRMLQLGDIMEMPTEVFTRIAGEMK